MIYMKRNLIVFMLLYTYIMEELIVARRFIVEEKDIKSIGNECYEIIGKELKHIQVLRHDVGDNIIINNGIYKISKMTRDSVIAEYIKEAPIVGVPSSDITLYIAYLKSDKIDFLVQKAVEIGVKRIVPFFSNNVVVKLEEKDKVKRKIKFQKIADEACKQCGRMDTVVIEDFIPFKELVNNINSEEKALFAYEASHDSLRTQIKQIKENNMSKVGIIIGAEGGFTPKEAEELKKIENVSCVSLGTRILRAETAALNLLSIVVYEMEE